MARGEEALIYCNTVEYTVQQCSLVYYSTVQ